MLLEELRFLVAIIAKKEDAFTHASIVCHLTTSYASGRSLAKSLTRISVI